MVEKWLPRGAVIAVAAGFGAYMPPFGLSPARGAAMGAALGAALVLVESRLRHATLGRLLGAALGAGAGLTLALLASSVLSQAFADGAGILQTASRSVMSFSHP